MKVTKTKEFACGAVFCAVASLFFRSGDCRRSGAVPVRRGRGHRVCQRLPWRRLSARSRPIAAHPCDGCAAPCDTCCDSCCIVL